jgi:hypothetical protein
MDNNVNKPKFLNQKLTTQNELVSFLRQEQTPYSEFILSVYFRENGLTGETYTHHIQPKHSNGTNHSWNLITLTMDEHALAHKLLFESYNNYYDYCAWCMMNGKTADAMNAMRKQNQLRMKERNVGFYNSESQRELANRPKKQRQRYARNKYIKEALKRGFVLQSIKTNTVVLISPNECNTVYDVLDLWLSHPEMEDQNKLWQEAVKKENFSLYTALTRSLTGHRDKRTAKAVYTVANWYILGIFI